MYIFVIKPSKNNVPLDFQHIQTEGGEGNFTGKKINGLGVAPKDWFMGR